MALYIPVMNLLENLELVGYDPLHLLDGHKRPIQLPHEGRALDPELVAEMVGGGEQLFV